MIRRPRWHGPTIAGRLRSDAALLVLMALVVAVTTLLTASVTPIGDRAADRAISAVVRDAGPGAAVVASPPRDPYASIGMARNPHATDELRRIADNAQAALPSRLAAILHPGITTVTTPPLHLLDGGPGRYVDLTYLDSPSGPPEVTYVAGRPPRPGAQANEGDVTVLPGGPPRPVEVAVSRPVARALGVGPGARLPAEDDQHRPIRIRISGVYAATDPEEAAWQLAPDLLDPARGVSQGVEQVTGGALVPPETLPDLQVAVPSDKLAQHVTFLTRPSSVRWRDAEGLTQEVAHLQVSTDAAATGLTWDSTLGGVLTHGRDQIVAAQGQAQVLLVGLVAAALLVLALAAQLLVSRRAGPIMLARERGASLVEIGGELLVESALVTAVGTTLGLVAADLLADGVGWRWSVPIVVVAVVAAPVYGAVVAARSTSARRVPANRSARRALDRARRTRRLAVEASVLAAAALSVAALRQRGVEQSGWGGLTAAAAATLCAAAGTLVVVRLLAPAVRLGQRATRRSVGDVGLLVTARLSQTVGRVLPVLAVSVAVAQLTFGVALAATEHRGQEAGALLAVGGDARLSSTADDDLGAAARDIARAPGVRVAVAGRVEDGVKLVSDRSAASVRVVVVPADDYRQLLASSPLPDAPELGRLGEGDGDPVPALLLGGSADLRDRPVLRWHGASFQLDVVGTAPRVDASIEPVVVVDAEALARAGASATPNTVWAVGPGAAQALRAASDRSGSVTTYADELDTRRHDPLGSALVRLAAGASLPLLVFAILGVVLAAAAEAPARGQSLGRLRSLGLADRDLRKVLSGELLTTASVAALTGLALGLGCVVLTFSSLSLERITGQTLSPQVVVPWWIPLAACVVVLSALAVALSEWRRLRRRVLAQLLRS